MERTAFLNDFASTSLRSPHHSKQGIDACAELVFAEAKRFGAKAKLRDASSSDPLGLTKWLATKRHGTMPGEGCCYAGWDRGGVVADVVDLIPHRECAQQPEPVHYGVSDCRRRSAFVRARARLLRREGNLGHRWRRVHRESVDVERRNGFVRQLPDVVLLQACCCVVRRAVECRHWCRHQTQRRMRDGIISTRAKIMKFADEIDRDKAVIGIAFFRTSELTGLRGLEEPVGIHGRSLLASALKVAVAAICHATRSCPYAAYISTRVVVEEHTLPKTKRDAGLIADITTINATVADRSRVFAQHIDGWVTADKSSRHAISRTIAPFRWSRCTVCTMH